MNNQQKIYVEVCQHSSSVVDPSSLREKISKFLPSLKIFLESKSILSGSKIDTKLWPCSEDIESVVIVSDDLDIINVDDIQIDSANVNVYQINSDSPSCEELEDDEETKERNIASSHWLLPSSDFSGLWESLFYDEEVKSRLIKYIGTILRFSDNNVNSTVVSFNRVILLHGPPGTGKTSLCKALAQKTLIRLSQRYRYGQLIEINSHSLFSKWFSESGKLVMKMFTKIHEIIDDPDTLVFVLIDEIESLTACRKAAFSGTEPSDAVRVVNALLTQLDQIKRYPNVIILTTSNITEAIDLAFIDRADIKQYIGYPSINAIYRILISCVYELMNCNLIQPYESLTDASKIVDFTDSSDIPDDLRNSYYLLKLSRKCSGLSGRALRKLPFLAYSNHVQYSTINLTEFIGALTEAVKDYYKDVNYFQS